MLIPSGTLTDLSGIVGLKDNEEQFKDLPLIPRIIYLFGDIECHQEASRSYFLNDNQMPVCSRDVGIFSAIPIGLFFAAYRRVYIDLKFLILGFVPMGIDGLAQLLTSYESINIIRLITGLLAGLTLAFAISTLMHEVIDTREKKRTGQLAREKNRRRQWIRLK